MWCERRSASVWAFLAASRCWRSSSASRRAKYSSSFLLGFSAMAQGVEGGAGAGLAPGLRGLGSAGTGAGGCGWGATGCAGRPRLMKRSRAAAIFSRTFATCSLTCLHPRVAVANSAHTHSVLRRMSSLHREKETGTILAAQDRGDPSLRVGHDPDHVAAGVTDAGDVVRRAVRVVAHVAPHHLPAGFELGRRARVRRVAAVAVGEVQLEDLAALL